ncbi:iron-containing alcohol dehydrogenase [Dyella tabacisoli]|uniref:Maleylacetate reductase n=1 Tax=Dyella tabacisoli TaxID=2282381 RepID=A0A369UQN5_9GAMM|nr:iron-containing alcohol dehydrogenase [Dyella tabacisoli]RDD83074.1 maleylacetate reductase [Dyella tabacisoli]
MSRVSSVEEGRVSGWSMPVPLQTVSFGIPLVDALPDATRRLSARRVVVVTANSLAGSGGMAEVVRKALGPAFLSLVTGMRAHTPREDVIRLVGELSHADGVVAIGGGSVCDAVKIARFCLANGLTDAVGLDRLLSGQHKETHAIPLVSPSLPFIAVPTTLSAAEYTSFAGITDERGPHKKSFYHAGLAPDIVILDPQMTLATPPRLWLGTGIRALDHALETWCSITATPLSDATSFYAAKLLVDALEKAFESPTDTAARAACLEGAWLSIQGNAAGVKSGASHGIGRALGGATGMPHGETSCVMLPHVLRYNAAVNGDKQHRLASSIDDSGRELADIVADLVQRLGLPGRLRDSGVDHAQLDAIAQMAIHDPLLALNPRPIESVGELLRLLQQAW